MAYLDITKSILKNKNKKYKLIKQNYYIDDYGNKYKVDNKHVVFDPSVREIEVANILGQLYGGNIRIIPRINEPEGIKTPDYIIKNEKFDLKEITGIGKYVIQGNLKGKIKQANNFIIDITKTNLNEKEAKSQIENIYKSQRYLWINKIFLIRNKEIIMVYKRV